MSYPKLLFGQIAVEKSFCSEEDLQKAVENLISQAVRGDTVNLGTIMVEMKLLTDEQVMQILQIQRGSEVREEDKLFGKLAVYHEFCADDDVVECRAIQKDFARQKKSVPRIGELLVKHGKITAQERDAIVSLQFRIKDPDYWKNMEADWQRTREY